MTIILKNRQSSTKREQQIKSWSNSLITRPVYGTGLIAPINMPILVALVAVLVPSTVYGSHQVISNDSLTVISRDASSPARISLSPAADALPIYLAISGDCVPGLATHDLHGMGSGGTSIQSPVRPHHIVSTTTGFAAPGGATIVTSDYCFAALSADGPVQAWHSQGTAASALCAGSVNTWGNTVTFGGGDTGADAWTGVKHMTKRYAVRTGWVYRYRPGPEVLTGCASLLCSTLSSGCTALFGLVMAMLGALTRFRKAKKLTGYYLVRPTPLAPPPAAHPVLERLLKTTNRPHLSHAEDPSHACANGTRPDWLPKLCMLMCDNVDVIFVATGQAPSISVSPSRLGAVGMPVNDGHTNDIYVCRVDNRRRRGRWYQRKVQGTRRRRFVSCGQCCRGGGHG